MYKRQKFNKKNKGVSHAINLYKTGASLVDVGGESTRPGSKEVNENREWCIELIRP